MFCFTLTSFEAVPVDKAKRCFKVIAESATVVGKSEPRLVGQLGGTNEVSPSNFRAIKSDSSSSQIH